MPNTRIPEHYRPTCFLFVERSVADLNHVGRKIFEKQRLRCLTEINDEDRDDRARRETASRRVDVDDSMTRRFRLAEDEHQKKEVEPWHGTRGQLGRRVVTQRRSLRGETPHGAGGGGKKGVPAVQKTGKKKQNFHLVTLSRQQDS